MNGIYIEYSKLKQHDIEWLDNCGARWNSGHYFSEIKAIGNNVQFTRNVNDKWAFWQYYGDKQTHCQTADDFCKGVAERLGIEYKAERTEEYFQKKLADKLAEHARADAGFPDTKEEVKYKHLRECFHWDEDRYILSESFDTVIRAVLKDLPQEYVVCSNESFRYGRFGELAPHDTGNIFQRIGSITEKVEIVKEGFV
jgi:hypothetical protein